MDEVQNQRGQTNTLGASVAAARFLQIGWILAVAATLRLSTIFIFRSFLHPQTWEFGQIAHSVVQGHGYRFWGSLSALMPPGYTLLLAGLYAIFGEGPNAYLVMELLQVGLGVLLVYLVYRLALTLYLDEASARLAAILAAVYPSFIQMCSEIHSISFYIVLSVLVVLFIVKAIQEPLRWDYLFFAGISMGVLLLFRAEALLLAAIFAARLCFEKKRIVLVRPLIFLAVAYGFLTPWAIRNYRVFDEFIPTTTASGITLWMGNNPLATGSDRTETGYMAERIPPAMEAELLAVPMVRDKEVKLDHIFQREAASYMVSHPWREVWLAAKKLQIFWSFDPNHKKGRHPGYWMLSALLSIFAALGLFVGKRDSLRELSPLLISIAFSVLVDMVFVSLPRHKILIDPFLCVFAAIAGSKLILARVVSVRGPLKELASR